MRTHKCTMCGKIEEWGLDWQWYGSMADEEDCPKDIIKTCSKVCKVVLDKRLKDGTIKLPVIGSAGMIVSERVGY